MNDKLNNFFYFISLVALFLRFFCVWFSLFSYSVECFFLLSCYNWSNVICNDRWIECEWTFAICLCFCLLLFCVEPQGTISLVLSDVLFFIWILKKNSLIIAKGKSDNVKRICLACFIWNGHPFSMALLFNDIFTHRKSFFVSIGFFGILFLVFFALLTAPALPPAALSH